MNSRFTFIQRCAPKSAMGKKSNLLLHKTGDLRNSLFLPITLKRVFSHIARERFVSKKN